MPTLRFPFHLVNHNKDAAINILIIFISIGSIIFNVNYFHTTIVKNGQIINQPTNAFQSDFSLAALWRNENHAGVKDANPVAVNQETPKL
ncbi:TPA: type II secretion system protein GspC, partial [Escherichia coli]|nr:type II secretion system protein GspC [Escherichia coli]